MLKQCVIPLEEILCFDRPVYAHRKEGTAEKETLQSHTELTVQYFSRLLEKKKMQDVIRSMEQALIGQANPAVRSLFREAFMAVPVFHDTGKMNPRFQVGAMKNSLFQEDKIKSLKGSRHSMLSAAIYLDYFAAKTEKLSVLKQEMTVIYRILLINAFVIARHHGRLEEYNEFARQLETGGELNLIWLGMEVGEYSALYRGRFGRMGSQVMPQRIRRSGLEPTENFAVAGYLYTKLLLSLLNAADYYATNEYVVGTVTTYFGSADEIQGMKEIYNQSERIRRIREFERAAGEDDGVSINYLRNKMFLEAERNLRDHMDGTLFFLEAPTGGGKSNIALNCSFQLLEEQRDKLIYVYPYNTLVEQNKNTLEEIFGKTEFFKKIAILNSITPIPRDRQKKSEKDENTDNYNKALLDRQFLNYPFVLTTHVSLFETMFGTEREAVFGFHQLVGSVIVLDEIQSYKNTIWSELIRFLEAFGVLLHCKILIMSATLPDFELLTGKEEHVVRLMTDRERYFSDKRFRERVKISYELLEKKVQLEELYLHIKQQLPLKKKIMIEFIKKDMAYTFYRMAMEDDGMDIPVRLMTGDDNCPEREKILDEVKNDTVSKNGFLLIATQVVEAGIDIDMDIGYKDISLLDSEEQFLGRINRNSMREGIVYFFNLCEASGIYCNDFRLNREVTLQNETMRQVLKQKNFSEYYRPVLRLLIQNRNNSCGREGMEHFLREELGRLDFEAVEKRMRLIDEDNWSVSVFLARKLKDRDGKILDGVKVWEEYGQLLRHPPKEYAELRVKMAEIKCRLQFFIYEIKRNADFAYNDRIGELYYIENGENYFTDGKLDRQKLETAGAQFL